MRSHRNRSRHAREPARDRRPGSTGKPILGVESEIVGRGPVDDETELDDVVGELVVHGPNVMAGYYELPGANEAAFTEEDGERWFHTGDLGYHDEDGFFYVVAREKHMIVTGGYNVYPREVEFRGELPRTTTGKVQEFELRAE